MNYGSFYYVWRRKNWALLITQPCGLSSHLVAGWWECLKSSVALRPFLLSDLNAALQQRVRLRLQQCLTLLSFMFTCLNQQINHMFRKLHIGNQRQDHLSSLTGNRATFLFVCWSHETRLEHYSNLVLQVALLISLRHLNAGCLSRVCFKSSFSQLVHKKKSLIWCPYTIVANISLQSPFVKRLYVSCHAKIVEKGIVNFVWGEEAERVCERL